MTCAGPKALAPDWRADFRVSKRFPAMGTVRGVTRPLRQATEQAASPTRRGEVGGQASAPLAPPSQTHGATLKAGLGAKKLAGTLATVRDRWMPQRRGTPRSAFK